MKIKIALIVLQEIKTIFFNSKYKNYQTIITIIKNIAINSNNNKLHHLKHIRKNHLLGLAAIKLRHLFREVGVKII